MNNKVCVIVNPAAGRGRGARALPDVRRAFANVGVDDVRISSSKQDEKVVARRAIADGCTTLAAVGGDGTWSNVANAILEARADVRLALLAAGTGNDFVKTIGAPARDLDASARLATEGPDHRVDVGRIENRYFLNIAGFGFDVAVLEDSERVSFLTGNAVYIYSALRQLFSYRPSLIDLQSAEGEHSLTKRLMLVIANARHFGGAFHIAPRASITDGLLDAISIGDATAMRRLTLFAAAARGTHVSHPEVTVEQSSAFHLRFQSPPAYETDGEYHRAASAQIEVACVPRALRVVSPAGAVGG
ncbi:MAG: diacylglycerol kinase family lipid kinase [Gemmatimonadota bacterium]|nr:diacylglycerol kinase family lipid kinase [Gemmatimonadota bacterium]